MWSLDRVRNGIRREAIGNQNDLGLAASLKSEKHQSDDDRVEIGPGGSSGTWKTSTSLPPSITSSSRVQPQIPVPTSLKYTLSVLRPGPNGTAPRLLIGASKPVTGSTEDSLPGTAA